MTENENRLSEGPGCRLVRIERIANNCWRAREWSAFLVCLLLPARGFRCYSREGVAVVELTDIGLSELRNRSLAENNIIVGVNENRFEDAIRAIYSSFVK